MMTCGRMIFPIVLLSLVFFSSSSSRADENADANRLFVETVSLWKKAASGDLDLSWPDRLELAQSVHENLQLIVAKMPGSNLAARLVADETVGVISLENVQDVVRKLEECRELPSLERCESSEKVFLPKTKDNTKLVRVVAAKKPIAFGEKMTFEHARKVLKFVFFPEKAVPTGVFHDAQGLFGEDLDQVRYTTRDYIPGELILKRRLTGPGEAVGRRLSLPIDMVRFSVGTDPADALFDPGDRPALVVMLVKPDGEIEWPLLTEVTVTMVNENRAFFEVPLVHSDLLHLAEEAGVLRLKRK